MASSSSCSCRARAAAMRASASSPSSSSLEDERERELGSAPWKSRTGSRRRTWTGYWEDRFARGRSRLPRAEQRTGRGRRQEPEHPEGSACSAVTPAYHVKDWSRLPCCCWCLPGRCRSWSQTRLLPRSRWRAPRRREPRPGRCDHQVSIFRYIQYSLL